MKKLLALVLAMVMTLGLATVGASAAAYTDAADITYTEAADVMSALKVFDGQNGAFNPSGILTREQGAKIIAYMILGKTAADGLTTAKSSFADVAPERWSAGSIEYCVSTKIVGGAGKDANGNDVFNPEAELTGYAFAKMCLVALGYNPNYETFVGGDWAINVAKVAADAGLDKNLASLVMSKGITREQAAQMALNTEKATMVTYRNPINVKGSDGMEVTVNAERSNVGNGTYNYRYNNGAAGTVDGDFTQFVERYNQGTKVYLSSNTDDFGRPANVWKLGNSTIGKYGKTATLTYTAGVKGGKLYEDLGRPSFSTSWDVNQYMDSASANVYNVGGPTADNPADIIKSGNTTALANSGAGVKTEVFYDAAKETLDIVQTGTYLAKALTAYNTSSNKLPVLVGRTGAIGDISEIDGVDFPVVQNVVKDQYVYVTLSLNGGKYEVKSVELVPASAIVTDVKVSSYKANDWVNAGGTQYTVAKVVGLNGVTNSDPVKLAVNGEWSLNDSSYDLVLDQYGNVLGAALNTAGKTNAQKYLFISNTASYDGLGSVRANAYFTDGTAKVITITKTRTNADASYATVNAAPDVNKFYTYTVQDDGTYALTNISTQNWGGTVELKAGNATAISGTYPMDSKTALIVGKDGKLNAYVGVANFPTVDSALTYYVYSSANVVQAVYSEGSAKNIDAKAFMYVFPGAGTTAEGTTTYYTYKIFRNGAIETNVAAASQLPAEAAGKGGMFKIEYNSKDRVVLSSSTYLRNEQADTYVKFNNVYKTSMSVALDVASGATMGVAVSNGNITVVRNGATPYTYTLNSSVEYYLIDAANADNSKVITSDQVNALPVVAKGNSNEYQVVLVPTSSSDASIAKVWIIKGAGL